MGRLIVVAGGSRSGKSAYAEQWVKEYGAESNVFYVATGYHTFQKTKPVDGEFAGEELVDTEFAERIAKHRQRRPQEWTTIEEPCELPQVLENTAAVREGESVYLIDGIGTWIANLMYMKEVHTEDVCRGYAEQLLAACETISGVVVAVADEVGMDVVPEHREGRIFRDLNGMVNQMLAARATEVYFVVCGLPVKIKG